jgi:hypothetical protein
VANQHVWGPFAGLSKKRVQFVGNPIASAGQRSSIATSIARTVVATDPGESSYFRLNATPLNKWAAKSGFKDDGWPSVSGAADIELEAPDVYQPSRFGKSFRFAV